MAAPLKHGREWPLYYWGEHRGELQTDKLVFKKVDRHCDPVHSKALLVSSKVVTFALTGVLSG